MKYSINRLKLFPCEAKNKKYNNKLASEFYKNLLLKKIFSLIYNLYKDVAHKKAKLIE